MICSEPGKSEYYISAYDMTSKEKQIQETLIHSQYTDSFKKKLIVKWIEKPWRMRRIRDHGMKIFFAHADSLEFLVWKINDF